MKEFKVRSGFILRLLLWLLLMYTICRIGFAIYNYSDLDMHSSQTWISVILYGLRFDISSIILINIFFILLHLLPVRYLINRRVSIFLQFLFLTFNIFFIFLNCIDIVYFPFVLKRMQSDVVLFVNGQKGNELFNLLPTFFIQYLPVWLLFGAITYILVRVYKLEFKKFLNRAEEIKFTYHSVIYPFLVAGLSIIAARGGIQLRPISVIQASDAAGVTNGAAVLNSPFSFLQTWGKSKLEEVSYFSPHSFNSCQSGTYPPHLQGTVTNKPNVVIIMVESLSKAYLKRFGGTVETPFLDSLMNESLVFNNAFANARESVQGVPAVLASVPSMMEEAFIFSRYSTNRVNSFASILKSDDYSSAFFHAGTTGTMGFSSFCAMTGFDRYFGKEDYPDEGDFDGTWGIWDHKFFPFMADKISALREPFVAGVLSMNPHSPFRLPVEYENVFATEGHPVKGMLKYEDFAISRFFEEAKKQAWYKNTLFVITADHTGPGIRQGSKMDDFRVPIIFFSPKGIFKGVSNQIAAQIDIMPTVLNWIGARNGYVALGKDLFSDTCEKSTIVYHAGTYHYIDAKYYLQFDREKITGIYDWNKDPDIQNNLTSITGIEQSISASRDNMLKYIQKFNHNMIHNSFNAN